jgi:threonine dehydrogenase-like Zn-dependent dehydrogenase
MRGLVERRMGLKGEERWSSMRALVLQDWWKLVVEDRPDPTPSAGEVLVRILATGICGSDLHGYTGENGRRVFGQIMGHETVGRIEALGSGVEAGELKPGALVTFNPVVGCGRCAYCASGNPQGCADKVVIGVASDYISALAEVVAVPAANVVVLPESTPTDYGALVEPLAVGYHAARRGHVGSEDAVLVLGGGPIGQACVLGAQRLGARAVVVSEPNEQRRELCTRLGAGTVDPVDADLAAGVRDVLGRPPTVVIDSVGTTRSLESALACAPLMSTVVLVGMGQQLLTVAGYELSTKERSVVGSFCYTPQEFRETAAWVGSTEVDLSLLVQDHVGLEGADAAFAELARGNGSKSKVLVLVNE